MNDQIRAAHQFVASEVVKDQPGATTVIGHCACGWSGQSTGWTVKSTTENGVLPAHERHLREVAGRSTTGDRVAESAPLAVGAVVGGAVLLLIVVLVFALAAKIVGGGGDEPALDQPSPTGTDFGYGARCEGAVRSQMERDFGTNSESYPVGEFQRRLEAQCSR